MSTEIAFRSGAPDDASVIAALAIQVFLDTYATDGVRPDLAREAFREYAIDAFAARLREPERRFVLAFRDAGLVGFAEVVVSDQAAPAGELQGAELIRLYVQPAFQAIGLGRRLLSAAESVAAEAGCAALWLTAWTGNHRACAFYDRQGYADIGQTVYHFEGQDYPNRVFGRQLA
ncbi:GNAT family N-acetyltransferase [Roseateles chitinivorans]|uniref:GNAT family N-acetyltransferase n=1 Tax=Roseateles chitinivorans TaxID=2917965 RepID=UPI003D66FB0F